MLFTFKYTALYNEFFVLFLILTKSHLSLAFLFFACFFYVAVLGIPISFFLFLRRFDLHINFARSLPAPLKCCKFLNNIYQNVYTNRTPAQCTCHDLINLVVFFFLFNANRQKVTENNA